MGDSNAAADFAEGYDAPLIRWQMRAAERDPAYTAEVLKSYTYNVNPFSGSISDISLTVYADDSGKTILACSVAEAMEVAKVSDNDFVGVYQNRDKQEFAFWFSGPGPTACRAWLMAAFYVMGGVWVLALP